MTRYRLSLLLRRPKLSLPAADLLALAAVLAVAAAVHLWLFAHTPATARDTTLFARAALQIEAATTGPAGFAAALRGCEHPPGYPLAVLAASVPVRALVHAPLPDQMILAARIASLVAGLLLALVHYRLARELFDAGPAFVAAAFFQVLPVPARITADGLSDGLYLLFLGLALIAGVRAVRSGSWRGFLWCGLASAAAYLVRPEGLLAAAAVGGVVVLLALARKLTVRAAAVRLAALLCGVALLAAPYMATVGGVTNKPTGKKLLHRLIGSTEEEAAAPVAKGPLLGTWYPAEGGGSKAAWAVNALGGELTKAFHYAGIGFAVIGVIVARRRIGTFDPAMLLVTAFALLALLLAAGLAFGAGYVSERHTLPVVFVGCLFAGIAAEPQVRAVARLVRCDGFRRPGVVLGVAAVFVAGLPATLRPLHASRAGHVAAGHWLAEHAAPADRVVDPFEWAAFYSGRTLHAVPVPDENAAVVYAVVEPGKERPRGGANDYAYSLAVARDGHPVWHWPEKAERSAATVVVYRFTRDGR